MEQTIEQNELNTAAYLTLAFLHEKNDDPEAAMAVYEKALKRMPRWWPAANNLAFLMAENPNSPDDLDRALKLAKRAEKVKHGEPTVLDTLGWIHYKQGNKKMAWPSAG